MTLYISILFYFDFMTIQFNLTCHYTDNSNMYPNFFFLQKQFKMQINKENYFFYKKYNKN